MSHATLSELSRRTGIPYYRVLCAHRIGAIPEPRRIGHLRVYSSEEIEAIKSWFAARDGVQQQGRPCSTDLKPSAMSSAAGNC
jgi:hypothetical protein